MTMQGLLSMSCTAAALRLLRASDNIHASMHEVKLIYQDLNAVCDESTSKEGAARYLAGFTTGKYIEEQQPRAYVKPRFLVSILALLQEFTGQWVVEPATSNSGTECLLRYEISIAPKVPIPASVVTQIVKCGLPANLNAVANRAEGVGPTLRSLCSEGYCCHRHLHRLCCRRWLTLLSAAR